MPSDDAPDRWVIHLRNVWASPCITADNIITVDNMWKPRAFSEVIHIIYTAFTLRAAGKYLLIGLSTFYPQVIHNSFKTVFYKLKPNTGMVASHVAVSRCGKLYVEAAQHHKLGSYPHYMHISAKPGERTTAPSMCYSTSRARCRREWDEARSRSARLC